MAIKTRNLVIYHIPKCGGTWVKVALENAGVRYRPVRNVKGEHPFNLKIAHATPDVVVPSAKRGRMGVAFVREPVAWYTSYWSFRSRKGARRDEKFPADGLWSDDFDQFVNNVLDAFPSGFVTELYQYFVGAGLEKVDFVGKQESLVDDLVHALRVAGERFDEKGLRDTARQNESPQRWKRKCVLSDATRERVVAAESWVYRGWNYLS